MLSKVRSHFFEHGKLYILIVVFLLLTSTYNITLPLGRGYDEFAHFQYIRFMAEHLRPPMTETERGQGGYKSRHHPPFYQGVAGFLFSWVDSEDTVFKRVVYGDIPQEALIFEVQDVHWFLPTEIMNYPYQQAILLWHLSRLFSSLLSAGAIIVTYFTALELFPGKKTWVLLAAATLAFIPRFVYTSSVASDDNMLAFLMALYLFLMVRLIKGCDHWCLFILLGVVLGLGITTKFSIGLVPVMTIAIFGFLAWRQSWPWKTLVKRTAVLTLTICLVSSWWFIFVIWNFNKITTEGFFWGILNAVLPHVVNNVSGADLLAAFQDPPMVERQPLLMGPWLIHLGQSFWAVPFITTLTGFPLEPGVFWLVLMVAGLVIVGWIMVWPRLNQVQQISLVILGLFILSFLPFMLMRYYLNGIIFETAQGRHILMPAAAAVGILLMVGWAGWTRPTVFNWLRPLLPMFLLFWSLIHLHYIYNVYPKPLPLSINSTTMLQVDTPVNLMFFDSFEFVGYNVDVLPDQAILETTLVWQAHQPASKDYLVEVQLLNQQGQLVSHWISHAADGLYPTRVWERGEIIYDRVKLPIYNLNAGSYTLQAYLLEAYQQPLLQVAGPLFSEPITIKDGSRHAPDFKQLSIDTKNGLVKVGYQLWPFDFFSFSRPEYHHRATISIVWEASDTLQPNQRLLIKLVGPDGRTFESLTPEGNLKLFMVEAYWPAGLYRLKAEIVQGDEVLGQSLSAPFISVKNGQRQFTLPLMAHQLDANFYHYIKLAGYDLPDTRVEPGENLSVFVHWQSLQIVNASPKVFNHLYDMGNQLWASFDHVLPPYYGGAIMWVPGEFVSDGYTIPIASDVPEGIYTLRVGLFLPMGEDAWVPLSLINDGQVSDVTYVTLGPIKIGSAPADVLALNADPQYPRDDRLGEVIKLKGYDLAASPETQALKLTLYWESLAPTEKDYTTFLHLQNEQGQVVAQKDSPPAGGAYPTSLWDAGEIIKDEIVLPISDSVSAGNYALLVGMYDFNTGERLHIPASLDNAIHLTLFESENLLP